MQAIYFDNNATTALDQRLLASLIDQLGPPLNPSSPHREGRIARAKLLTARRKIALALKVQPEQIAFTSGGTEAINLAIRGLFKLGGHVVTSKAEHSCVLSTLRSLYPSDQISELDPGLKGAVDVRQVAQALRPNTHLVALTAANNETGAITDLAPLAALAEEKKIALVVDAICAFGKIEVAMLSGISALCLAGHKFHGPQGAGLICLKPGIELIPQLTGGPQEYQRRAGTENVPAIIALAEAIAIAVEELKDNQEQMLECRKALWSCLCKNLPDIERNGPDNGLPNTLNIYFPKVQGQLLFTALDQRGLSASRGAACSSGLLGPSHVLLAMGFSALRAENSLRFSLSKFTTMDEVERGADIIVETLKRFKRK